MTMIIMSQYILKLLNCFGGNVKVELDLSNYWQVLIHRRFQKIDLAGLKSDLYKLDIDKLKTIPPLLENF